MQIFLQLCILTIRVFFFATSVNIRITAKHGTP